MGPKSGNVEKVLVFVCFLEGQRGEGSFGSLNSDLGGRFLGLARRSDMCRGKHLFEHPLRCKQGNINKQFFEQKQ